MIKQLLAAIAITGAAVPVMTQAENPLLNLPVYTELPHSRR